MQNLQYAKLQHDNYIATHIATIKEMVAKISPSLLYQKIPDSERSDIRDYFGRGPYFADALEYLQGASLRFIKLYNTLYNNQTSNLIQNLSLIKALAPFLNSFIPGSDEFYDNLKFCSDEKRQELLIQLPCTPTGRADLEKMLAADDKPGFVKALSNIDFNIIGLYLSLPLKYGNVCLTEDELGNDIYFGSYEGFLYEQVLEYKNRLVDFRECLITAHDFSGLSEVILSKIATWIKATTTNISISDEILEALAPYYNLEMDIRERKPDEYINFKYDVTDRLKANYTLLNAYYLLFKYNLAPDLPKEAELVESIFDNVFLSPILNTTKCLQEETECKKVSSAPTNALESIRQIPLSAIEKLKALAVELTKDNLEYGPYLREEDIASFCYRIGGKKTEDPGQQIRAEKILWNRNWPSLKYFILEFFDKNGIRPSTGIISQVMEYYFEFNGPNGIKSYSKSFMNANPRDFSGKNKNIMSSGFTELEGDFLTNLIKKICNG